MFPKRRWPSLNFATPALPKKPLRLSASKSSSNLSKSRDSSGWRPAIKILTPASRSFILLNRMIFRGTLKAQNVFEAICSAFVTSPDVCLYLDNKFTLNQDFRSIRDKSSQNKFWIIILNIVVLVVLLCVAALAMILIFGKIYQRILNENVSEMVRNSINNYSMSQERS